MVLTYTGILREQGRIEWDGPSPTGVGVRVTLTVEQPASPPDTQGRIVAQIMEQLSKTDLHKAFGDPLE